jgi:hypothetical protein
VVTNPRPSLFKEEALRFADGIRSLSRSAGWTTALAGQPEPSALVTREPSCYHFRVLDPRVCAILSATIAAVTIGHCYHN